MQRRDFLRFIPALGGNVLLAQSSGALAEKLSGSSAAGSAKGRVGDFPKGFLWGAATAAYQIEGATDIDGRGESIWDRYAHTPGKIKGGANAGVACDSYHRYVEDIAIAKRLGMKSYRYSIAWPRVQPLGSGAVNQKGLDYYRRLTDALLESGIRPLPTLYHWDLPQPLEDAGGWPQRDTAMRLADYARIVVDALGDRIDQWVIFNEPYIFTVLGYAQGIHAPGRKEPLAALRATHVVNLAQGLAYRAIKASRPHLEVGGAYSVAPTVPATASIADRAAADRQYKFGNLWFIDPALKGHYPDGVLPSDRQSDLLGFRSGDDDVMRAPLDFIGLNYYSCSYVQEDAQALIPGLSTRAFEPKKRVSREKTDFGWDIYPKGLYDIVTEMAAHTGRVPIEITENGAAYNIGPAADGGVHDAKRIAYTRAHLLELSRAIHDGAQVRAYYHWSLLDNFEWSVGYSQRFGLIYVDFANGQKRIPKDSAAWYAKVIAENKVA